MKKDRLPKIRLMAEYGGDVLWYKSGEQIGPVDLDQLNLSPAVREKIARWASLYDQTLNHSDPLSSGFESQQAETDFITLGSEIFRMLRRELAGIFEVEYEHEVTAHQNTQLSSRQKKIAEAIDLALADWGSNEIPVWDLLKRIETSQPGINVNISQLLEVLIALEKDGIFEFLENASPSEHSLIARV